MSEDKVYVDQLDIPQTRTGEGIYFNAGHTADIKKYLPGLLKEKGTNIHSLKSGDNKPEDVLTITTDTIVKYLEEHQTDNPHSIATLIQLTAEEAKHMVINPFATAEYIAQLRKEIEENQFSTDEVPEIQEQIRSGAELVQTTLARFPKQIDAINRLLKDEQFKTLYDQYVATYGSDIRIGTDGIPTAQTNAQFLKSNWEIILRMVSIRKSQIEATEEKYPEYKSKS